MAKDIRLSFGPASLKQQMVLQDMETDLLVVGGGNGGGKSHMALVKALKYVQDPNAVVLIVRLSYPLLKSAGGLVSESKHIYSHFKATWKEQKLEWHFPNGALIKFYAMPQDLTQLQGQQYSNIIVDEAAEFTLADILALRARLRAVRYKGKLNMMATCNPSRSSWLFDFISYSLDEEGVPLAGTEDITRWFVILAGKIFWGNSREELFEKHGQGYILGDDFRPLSFRFIPMDIYSNPILLKNNPAYLADLLAQSRVNQLRFLKGSWTAVTEGNSYIRREWFNFVDFPPSEVTNRGRGWDTAASVVSESNPHCDATAGVLMSRDKMGHYYIEDCNTFRKLTDGVLREIANTAHNDGLNVPVLLERDTGAGGKIANVYFTKYLSEQGCIVRSTQMSGHSSKINRILPFAQMVEARAVSIVRYGDSRDEWIEPYLTELEGFDGGRGGHDDMVDATGCVFNYLCRSVQIPTFTIPSLTQSSPIPTI